MRNSEAVPPELVSPKKKFGSSTPLSWDDDATDPAPLHAVNPRPATPASTRPVASFVMPLVSLVATIGCEVVERAAARSTLFTDGRERFLIGTR
ncbi:MAG: hypothetical protein ACJA2W_000226 [Planctomycetota bacterium]|jgi:hypothetical protein|tara:strand:+ start:196 stop:477 length:282 start_codon:yes stop_codon:yes gene_type:complete